MANINFLVYNTTTAYGGGSFYKIVRYGVCDATDLPGQAYEVNDVAVVNTAGAVPEYTFDGVYGRYPIYNPTTNVISTELLMEPPPYDAFLDPTNYRLQADGYDSTNLAILRAEKILGCFGLGGEGSKGIGDFGTESPVTGFYGANESTAIGGPDPGSSETLTMIALSQKLFLAWRATGNFRSWVGWRPASTGEVTWKETTPRGLGTEYRWNMTNALAGIWQNTVGAGAGTFANTLPTLTNKATAIKRSLYSSVATTLNQVLGQRNTEAVLFRGVAASGMGGFVFGARFTFDTWTNGGRLFAGLHTGTGVITADPSGLNNSMGFAVDAADNGLIYFQTKSTTAANRISTGMTIVSGKAYDVEITCLPGVSRVGWKITDIVTGVSASGKVTVASVLPVATVGNTFGVLASNAALTAANAIQLGVAHIFAKTDL